jgi:glycerophosphoryl diester phosphodiesterase
MLGSKRALAVAAAVFLGIVGLTAPPAGALRAGCVAAPVHAPWAPGTDPGPPAAVPFLSAHRGGQNLAPQQTPEAYKSALAFGTTVIEGDLHVLADGGLAIFHDDTAPDGRFMSEVTSAEFKSWNAATGRWAATAFDPAHYVFLDEFIAIARAAKSGMDLEFKDLDPRANAGAVPPYRVVAQKVADAGLMDKTIWQYHDGEQLLLSEIKAVDPAAHFNYNLLDYEPPAQLYAKASRTDFSFGSNLVKFTPERLAAIHDGCGLAVPHSYDAGKENEGAEIAAGYARGIDGFQTNQVDVAVAALHRPAPSKWIRTRSAPTKACLVNPTNGYGLLGRAVVRSDGKTDTTGPGGCVDAGFRLMRFAGDAAAKPASERWF